MIVSTTLTTALFAHGDDMNPSPFWVLMALCDHVNEDDVKEKGWGRCWPALSRISQKAHVSEATARRAIKELVSSGIVESSQEPERSRIFTISLEKIKGLKECEPLTNLSPLANCEPLTDSTGLPSQILKGAPNKSDTPPLTNLAPEPIKEPVKEPRNEHGKKQDASRAKKGEAWKKWIKVEKPAEVPDDLWKQFGEIRALKKMALTERAFDLLRSEGEKAHMTLLQVVETCCGNGWAGFKASWLTRTSGSTYRKPQNVTQTAEYRERLQACCRGEGRTEKLADDGVTIIVD